MALLGGSFPSFDALPQVFNFGGRYRDSAENPKYYLSVKNRDVPRLHWVLMGEITSSSCAFRHEQRITTLHGERDVRIMFYHDASETSKFDLSKLRVGSTLAILYAHQKLFLDLTKGVRQENLSSVMVFNSPISIVRSEAGKLLGNADSLANGAPLACFSCGAPDFPPTSRHLACGKCKCTYYCSVDCQRAHWPTHKKLCPDADVLLQLACLPRQPFSEDSPNGGFYTSQTLPPYSPPAI
jgi:hypothetical protein